MTGFGERLRDAMVRKKITAAELSRISGVGKNLISYYLNGKYLAKQDKVYLLAEALDVDPGWLVTGVQQVVESDPWSFDLQRFSSDNGTAPKTEEAKIISAGIDKMTPERREQALKVLQTIFADYFDGGEKNET